MRETDVGREEWKGSSEVHTEHGLALHTIKQPGSPFKCAVIPSSQDCENISEAESKKVKTLKMRGDTKESETPSVSMNQTGAIDIFVLH